MRSSRRGKQPQVGASWGSPAPMRSGPRITWGKDMAPENGLALIPVVVDVPSASPVRAGAFCLTGAHAPCL